MMEVLLGQSEGLRCRPRLWSGGRRRDGDVMGVSDHSPVGASRLVLRPG